MDKRMVAELKGSYLWLSLIFLLNLAFVLLTFEDNSNGFEKTEVLTLTILPLREKM